MDLQTAQLLSWIGMALFAVVVVIIPIAIFTETSRRTIRWLALSALSATVIASLFCGLLYYWQHFVRVG